MWRYYGWLWKFKRMKRTIIANGGLFEKYIEVDGDTMERYWIKLQ